MLSNEQKELMSRVTNKIKTLTEVSLGDLASDPQGYLSGLSFESLQPISNIITREENQLLSEVDSEDAQSLCNIISVANDLCDKVVARIAMFSHEEITKRADHYFNQAEIDSKAGPGAKDFNDLKRIILGNRGNFFSPANKTSKFLKGDLLEQYFDDCLKIFKNSRSRDFMNLILKDAS